MFKKIILSSLLLFLISGCSSKYAVTFDSQPQGASLVCSGKNWGYTPTTLYYDEVKELTILDISECSANWISGAKSTYGTIRIEEYPDGVRQTLQRPNIDGYEKDATFALQVQTMRYQKAQAQAANSAASSARRQNYLNQQRNYQLQNINNYIRYGY